LTLPAGTLLNVCLALPLWWKRPTCSSRSDWYGFSTQCKIYYIVICFLNITNISIVIIVIINLDVCTKLQVTLLYFSRWHSYTDELMHCIV